MKEKLDGYDYFLERIKLSIKNVVIRDWYKCVWISDMQSLVLSREVYAEIYMAENELRAFISKVMIEHFGIDWNDRPEFYKLNTCQRRFKIVRKRRPNFVVSRRGMQQLQAFPCSKRVLTICCFWRINSFRSFNLYDSPLILTTVQ